MTLSWPLRVMIERYGVFRKATWRAAAQLVLGEGHKQLIETGCVRGTDSDGFSTLILAQLAKDAGGHLDSYELESRNIEIAKYLLETAKLAQYVTFHQGDSVLNLARRTEPIDFAYLDSFDCGTGPDFSPCQKHQLAEFEAIQPLFNRNAAVLLDDHVPETGGKTKLTMQRLDSLKWRNVLTDYQVLYHTADAQQLRHHRFAVLCGHLHDYAMLAVHTLYHNRAQYCLRHGYDLQLWRKVHPCFQDPQSHANGYSWSRLQRLCELLESGTYEWVWVVGADTLVTNLTLPLEQIVALAETPEAESAPLPDYVKRDGGPEPVIHWLPTPNHPQTGKKHLILCGECVAPVQADSFLVRASAEGIGYVREVLFHYSMYKHHPWVENQTMIDLRDKYAAITCVLPQWRMNSYDYTRFHKISDIYKTGKDCYGNRGQWQKGDFMIHWPAATLEQRMKWMKEYEERIVQ